VIDNFVGEGDNDAMTFIICTLQNASSYYWESGPSLLVPIITINE